MSSLNYYVEEYLDSFIREPPPSFELNRRFDCCGKSHALYCPECLKVSRASAHHHYCLFNFVAGSFQGTIPVYHAVVCLLQCKSQILIPMEHQPDAIRNGTVRLPFQLQVILTDKRNSATGLQAIALLLMCCNSRQNESSCSSKCTDRPILTSASKCNNNCVANNGQTWKCDSTNTSNNNLHTDDAVLIDFSRGESIPDYSSASGTTYVLYPSDGESIPLHEVGATLSRLVVLDCKWTKPSCKDHPHLAKLQKVHLSNPPQESHIWRWHNAGSGMISTIEAIFYAAVEVSQLRIVDRQHDITSVQKNICSSSLIHLLWLFGLQRAITHQAALDSGRTAPYSEIAKEENRALRRCQGTEKHAKDLEKGRQLKEVKRHARSLGYWPSL